MATQRLRLGQLLVDAKLIAEADLEDVLARQRADGRRLGTLLVERGLINETQLTQILSHQLAVPWVSLLHIEFSRQLLNLVPREVAERFCLVPIYVRHVRNQGETLYVAMDDPTNEDGLKACGEHSGLPVRAMIAPPQDIRSAIRVYYGVAPKGDEPAVSPESAAPSTVVEARRSQPASKPSPEEERAVSASAKLEVEPEAKLPLEERPAPKAAHPASIEPPTEKQQSKELPSDAPEVEAVEIDLKARRKSGEMAAVVDAPGDSPEVPVAAIPKPRGRTPRMVALTLLDGTTISLPAKPKSKRSEAEPPPEPVPAASEDAGEGLTARDMVAALRAVTHGADATEILGEHRWETLFAALLSLLLKKHLIADWEFVDELKKM